MAAEGAIPEDCVNCDIFQRYPDDVAPRRAANEYIDAHRSLALARLKRLVGRRAHAVILVLALLLTETIRPRPSQHRAAQCQATIPGAASHPASMPSRRTRHLEGHHPRQSHARPVFQEQLAKSHNQPACLTCHTTGFDAGSGKFMSEGVTCEACHGPYKEGHPAGQTMQLPMESATRAGCAIRPPFEEWEKSQHAAKQIDCFDCHQAHTQGVRTGER